MSKVLQINEAYLQELIEQVSKRVVGKVLKRHDIFEVEKRVKDLTKELIYEGFREFRDLVIAHNEGLNISVFNFKTKKGENLT